jgi:hypothetical protein
MVPPQFTLRAMLISIGCLGACLGCIRTGITVWESQLVAPFLIVAFVCFGAAIGAIVDRPFTGAQIATYSLLIVVMFILFGLVIYWLMSLFSR